jgi:hypothetical protein
MPAIDGLSRSKRIRHERRSGSTIDTLRFCYAKNKGEVRIVANLQPARQYQNDIDAK